MSNILKNLKLSSDLDNIVKSFIDDGLSLSSENTIKNKSVSKALLEQDYTSFQVLPTNHDISANTYWVEILSNDSAMKPTAYDSSKTYTFSENQNINISAVQCLDGKLYACVRSNVNKNPSDSSVTHDSLNIVSGDIYYPIPKQMTHKMMICTNYPKSESDLTVDWGDECSTVLSSDSASIEEKDEDKKYKITISHTYEKEISGGYRIKIYGKKYYGLRGVNGNNLIFNIFGRDFSIAKCVQNMASLFGYADRLTEINTSDYEYVQSQFQNVTNFANMFHHCFNLSKVEGLKMLLQRYEIEDSSGMFKYCYNLKECDLILCPSYTKTSGMCDTFIDCYSLTSNILSAFPYNGFSTNVPALQNIFRYCTNMELSCSQVDKLGEILWNSKTTFHYKAAEGDFKIFRWLKPSVKQSIPMKWGGLLDTTPTYSNIPISQMTWMKKNDSGNDFTVKTIDIGCSNTICITTSEYDKTFTIEKITKSANSDIIAISWGDGTNVELLYNTTDNLQHVYKVPGNYTIRIDDSISLLTYRSTPTTDDNLVKTLECNGEEITSLGENSFRNCKSLSSAVLPKNMTILQGGILRSTALTSLQIPQTVTKISWGSISQNDNLLSLNVPENVQTFGIFTCANLSSVTFEGNSVSTIYNDTFLNCKKILSVKIPQSATQIGNNFCTASGLSVISFENHTTIPTFTSTSNPPFKNMVYKDTFKIIVPDDIYDQWIAAPVWTSSYISSHIVKKSDF